MRSKRYYLYIHKRLDNGHIFYVGIGTQYKNGISYRRAYDFGKRNIYWKRVKEKYGVSVYIEYECNNYEYIKIKEKRYIEYYGDSICNLTEGGEGVLGYKHNQLARDKMSIMSKSRRTNKNYKERMKKIHKGRVITQSWRERISQSSKGKRKSRLHCIALSTSRKIKILFGAINKTNRSVLVKYIDTGETMVFKSLLETSKFFGKSKSWIQSYIGGYNNKYRVYIDYLLENNLLPTTT